MNVIYIAYNHVVTGLRTKCFFYYTKLKVSLTDVKHQNYDIIMIVIEIVEYSQECVMCDRPKIYFNDIQCV